MNINRGITVLIFGCVLCLAARTPFVLGQESSIEVIADGQRYESIEKYKEARMGKLKRPVRGTAQSGKRKTVAGLLRNAVSLQYASSVLTAGRFYTGPRDIEKYLKSSMDVKGADQDAETSFDPFLESYSRISRLGFNSGVARIVEEFAEHAKDSIQYKRLLAKDLEATLSRSFEAGDYSGPILIISHKKKVRIMTLEDRTAAQAGVSNP